MSDYADGGQPFFDVRNVNVIGLNKLVDIEILIAECDDKIATINDQIESRWGDSTWKRDAERARGQIERKRALAVLKRDAVTEAKAAEALKVPTDPFKARFIRAAEIILDAATFAQVLAAASRQGGPA